MTMSYGAGAYGGSPSYPNDERDDDDDSTGSSESKEILSFSPKKTEKTGLVFGILFALIILGLLGYGFYLFFIK
jgi:predicted nucleic acid-binding Zn ribbon protein